MFDWPRDLPILIAGPTAAGKSALAVQIAQAVKGVVINADALQVYDCWRILSARPTTIEMAGVGHHLYGHIDRATRYSAGHWLREIAALLPQLRRDDFVPIIVGGTGLYFAALTEGLAQIPDIGQDILTRAAQLAQTEDGLAQMLAQLSVQDPDGFAKIDQNNPMRVQRAWAVLSGTGRGLSAWHDDTPAPMVSKFSGVVLDADRDWLANRIDLRFDQMMASGAADEVRNVLETGWDPSLPSAKAIGAVPLCDWLNGQISQSEAITQAKAQSRQYAKRQRTWFRKRMKSWVKLNPSQDLSTSTLLNRLISP